MAMIKTQEDWFSTFKSMLDDGSLRTIAENVHGKDHPAHDEVFKAMEFFLEKKDARQLVGCMEMLWNDAPDDKIIHSWPRWHDLCDLCSESWVFNFDEYKAEEWTPEELSEATGMEVDKINRVLNPAPEPEGDDLISMLKSLGMEVIIFDNPESVDRELGKIFSDDDGQDKKDE